MLVEFDVFAVGGRNVARATGRTVVVTGGRPHVGPVLSTTNASVEVAEERPLIRSAIGHVYSEGFKSGTSVRPGKISDEPVEIWIPGHSIQREFASAATKIAGQKADFCDRRALITRRSIYGAVLGHRIQISIKYPKV